MCCNIPPKNRLHSTSWTKASFWLSIMFRAVLFTTRSGVLPVLKNKIEYGYRTLGYCPLTGYNPGSLPAPLLEITSLGRHLYTSGLTTVPCVEGVEQRRKSQLTFFFLSVTPWRHSDIPIRAPLSGPRGCRKSKSGRNLGLYVLKEQDSHELDISLRGTEDLSESLRVSGLKGLQIISYFNLFYSILWRAQSLWCI